MIFADNNPLFWVSITHYVNIAIMKMYVNIANNEKCIWSIIDNDVVDLFNSSGFSLVEMVSGRVSESKVKNLKQSKTHIFRIK